MTKIIIPTNDRETIAIHIGRCLELAIYTLDKGNIIALEFAKRNHSQPDRKGATKKSGVDCGHKELIRLFADADQIMYYAMGKNLKKLLDQNSLPYQKVNSLYLTEIIKQFAKEI